MSHDIHEVLARCDQLFAEGKDKDTILDNIDMQDMSTSEKAQIFMHVDTLVTDLALSKQISSNYSIQFVIGLFLFVIGSLITLGTFFSGRSQFVLAYGLILSGAWLAKNGYKKKNSKIEISTARRIRRKKRKW